MATELSVIVGGFSEMAEMLRRTERFKDVFEVSGTAAFQQQAAEGRYPPKSQLVVVFSDATLEDGPRLDLILSKLTSAGYPVLLLNNAGQAEVIAAKYRDLKVLSGGATVNHVLAAVSGMTASVLDPVPDGHVEVYPGMQLPASQPAGDALLQEPSNDHETAGDPTKPKHRPKPARDAWDPGSSGAEGTTHTDLDASFGAEPIPGVPARPAPVAGERWEGVLEPEQVPVVAQARGANGPQPRQGGDGPKPRPTNTQPTDKSWDPTRIPNAPISKEEPVRRPTNQMPTQQQVDPTATTVAPQAPVAREPQMPAGTPVRRARADVPEGVAMPQQGRLHDSSSCMVITVAASKGGTGKSSVALNIAAFLGLRTNQDVAIIDLNIQQPDVGKYIGDYDSATIVEVISNINSINASNIRDYLAHSRGGNFYALLGPHNPLMADPSVLSSRVYKIILDYMRQSFDYIIIDTPVAERYHDLVTNFAMKETDRIIFVVAPNWVTVHDARLYLESMTRDINGPRLSLDKIGWLLNQYRDDVDCDEEAVRDAMAAYRYLGQLPYTTEWQRANNNFELIVTQRYEDVNSAFANMLKEVTGVAFPARPPAEKKRSWFDRLRTRK